MCRKRTCPNCSKATWVGCGLHIDQALSGVSVAERCEQWKTGEDCGVKTQPKPIQFARQTTDSSVIDHVVMLKLSKSTSKDQLNSLGAAIKTLSSIPGVLSITCGPCFVPSSSDDRRSGFNYSLCVRLDSNDGLNNYAGDEEHLRIKKEIIAPLLSKTAAAPKIIAVDWDSEVATNKKEIKESKESKEAVATPWVQLAAVAGVSSLLTFALMKKR